MPLDHPKADPAPRRHRDPVPLDASACDREPIHTPGAIQPHGLLLVADAHAQTILAWAGDLEGRLSPRWMQRSLSDLLHQDVPGRIGDAPVDIGIRLDPVSGATETFEATAYRSNGTLFIELEPTANSSPSGAEVLHTLDAANVTFERAADLRDLIDRAALVFRQLTGFDRVMVYRFLDNDAGVVIAEARDPALGSFLNHHFPASDIPVQARGLYIRNRIRVIPDVDYTPCPLRSAAGGLPVLDMSDLALRSVSPIHIQYLKNMKVRASASISIVKDGILWGLVACHHRTPHNLSLDLRMICRTLVGGLARQIRAKEEAETYREQIRLRSAEDAVLARLGRDQTLDAFFAELGDDLRRMLGADGFAMLQGKDLFSTGRSPDRVEVRDIADWARIRAAAAPFVTHNLGQACGAARACQDTASGLLVVTLSVEEPIMLLWFRAEQIEVVNWAGNPHKAVLGEPGAALTPRTSFDAWSEEVRGQSRPWTHAEVEAANRLRRNMFEARQNQRVRTLNRELIATIADKENLLVQKDYLIKEVNHRVQNSLQLVSAFLSLQARSVGDPVLTDHLKEAQRRLSAVALVHRRLYSDDRVEIVDLSRYLDDLLKEMKTSMGAEWADKIALDLAPTLISADRAVNVGLILTELVINANKYAYGGASGPISISLEQHRARFRLIVADRGAGKSSAREGFGTRMLSAMVDRLTGTMEETDNEPGLRVIVSAPIEQAA